MDEQQVLEALRANTAAMNAQAMDQYAATFTEDSVWEDDALPAPALGPAGAAQTMGVFYAAFPDLHFEVERAFTSGDQGAVCWHVTATHQGAFAGIPPTGRRIDYHACGIFQLREGKIAYVRTYVPTGVILQQLGVLPGGDQAQEP